MTAISYIVNESERNPRPHSLGECDSPLPAPLTAAIFSSQYQNVTWSTGIRGLMRGMATLPQGYQELLVVKDKVGRPPGELGVSKSMECDIFPSVL